MKVTLTRDGRALVAVPQGDFVVVKAVDPCPACGEVGPLRARGQGNHVESRDTYAAVARALCCGAVVGTLRVKVDDAINAGNAGCVCSGEEVDPRCSVHGSREAREMAVWVAIPGIFGKIGIRPAEKSPTADDVRKVLALRPGRQSPSEGRPGPAKGPSRKGRSKLPKPGR